MRIEIVKIINEHIVEFSTAIGSGIGIWKSKDMQEGGIYDVEFDINPILEIGKNVSIVPAENCFIEHNGFENEIQGNIEVVDEDGISFLRLNYDCITMIESPIGQFKVNDQVLIKVNREDFWLTSI
jgi:hypothetical protein